MITWEGAPKLWCL